MELEGNFKTILDEISPYVTLVAVSKTKPDSLILDAYNLGQKDFGENRVQDMKGKAQRLPKDIRWHMIGRIQTNKIKDFISYVHLVHGVDRLKVLSSINNEAKKINRVIDVLIQVHIAKEETKTGFSFHELEEVFSNENQNKFKNIRIRGLMGMATFTENQNEIRKEFSMLKKTFENIKKAINEPHFDILSMGMSGDFQIAIREGSTMVRIGTLLFGKRNI
ncbi:MAG: YggS family pyridoxal phosphate-dependent enzyme [Cryomorphaceae bacterium]|jgi:pyridoxal phosphate enzyme (YggS family)|nr:YggS family pyridoxal phosphate-dependent enzyme [Cryomorphaceae bacterium]|tara:strand:+ start:19116 stop:19778 length:663 start_codon:yes stop_codon:yes gene_type:complete